MENQTKSQAVLLAEYKLMQDELSEMRSDRETAQNAVVSLSMENRALKLEIKQLKHQLAIYENMPVNVAGTAYRLGCTDNLN